MASGTRVPIQPGRACSRSGHPVSRSVLPARRFLRSPLPGGSARPSPAGIHVCPPFVRSVGAGLTTRSSEQRLAVRPLCIHSPSSPASVAELGGVRHLSPLCQCSQWSACSVPMASGTSVPVPVAIGSPVPSSSQHSSVPVHPIPLPRLSFGPVRSFVRPFPAAAPVLPPPEWPSVLPAVQRPLCRRGA